jgi:antitoxin HicB
MTKLNLEKYLAMSWHFSVVPSEWENEKGYWACVSELPNCSTFATSQAEALSTVAQLLPAYLEAAIESNADIPIPESRDSGADDVGGTIVLRLPKSLHIGLKNAAQAEKTSLNQFALYALTKMVYQTTSPLGAAKRVVTKKKSAAPYIPSATRRGTVPAKSAAAR